MGGDYGAMGTQQRAGTIGLCHCENHMALNNAMISKYQIVGTSDRGNIHWDQKQIKH